VVAIDDRTLAALGLRWPYPRRMFARAIDRLDAAGARAIVMDVEFSVPTVDDDEVLAAARRAGNVVFGTSRVDRAGRTDVLGGNEVLRYYGARAGDAAVTPGPGGVEERTPYAPTRLPSLAVAAAEVATRTKVGDAGFGDDGAWIDFAGPPETLAAVSFSDLMRGRFDPAAVRGRVAVVGATAPVLQDRHVTAVAPDDPMAGAEIQANAISGVLRDVPLRDPAAPLGWSIVIVAALLPAACLAAFRRRWPWIAVTAGAGLMLLVGAQVAFNAGRVIPVAAPMLALLLGTAAAFATDYAGLRAERRRLRRMFAQHAPGIVEQVLAGEADGLTATEVIPGYRFEEVLGRGGMGVVYRARQTALDRPVAVKLLRPEFAADPAFRARFEREARLAAAIEHPNVIPVYDAGECDGLLYVAMRYVDGVTLAELLSVTGPLEPRRALHIVGQVAGALDAAHAHGLVHRDVKPANILLTDAPAEHAYLSDFGLARSTAPGATMTAELLGTVDYMAPEQIDGRSVDGRTDVYALGCVLYELVTGEVPFRAPTELAKLWAHVNAPIPQSGTPLDAALAHALAKDPSERPASAGALVEEALRAEAVVPS
jgi:predicted Ser/Thr protein kinase